MKTSKEKIHKCAAKLFRKKGYKATSMRDIADAEGIKAASIYNHIKNKQALLQDLLISMAQLFTNGMKEILTSSLSPIEKMEKLIALHVRLTIDHTDAIALIAGEWVHLESPAMEQYVKLRDQYEKDFKKIINQCKKVGHFRNINTEIALFSTLSTLRWLYSWYSKNKKINPLELEQQMIDILMNGLKN